MARGGYRVGSGRKKGSKNHKSKKISKLIGDFTPLEYLLKVMNDPGVDTDIRIRCAIAAAPFCHPRAILKKGKKQEQEERAKQAGQGIFSAGKPPLKVVKRDQQNDS